ncbi:MAG TPA: MBL fold metallo-hydrolase [Acidimicrobiales bacterium]|nr:MBL fold metallo-hydrolase [Acidimicrobiales bacterium]
MGLSVTVLGCSGSYPGPGSACSGYLVGDGTTLVWLDAGSGTLANLQRHVTFEAIDAVVLSHEHPDHWSDLEGFQIVLQHAVRRQGVPVYAPRGLRDRTYQDPEPSFAWHEVADGQGITIGSLELFFSRTDHGPETLAVRVDGGGRSLGYSADTGPCWSLAQLGTGLDVVLCEATVPVEEEGKMQHLSARQAGEAARAARAGRLVLTHLWPTVDRDLSRREAEAAFGGPVAVAVDNERYEV